MSALDNILASRPAAAAVEEDNLGYIGMPKGYVATRTGPISIRQAERGQGRIATPRYKVGSEMEPRSYSPENIARLQQQLALAGLIGPETRFRLGVWDSTSINAYKNLLAYANQGGTSREDALQALVSSPRLKPGEDGSLGGGAGGGATAPQFSTRLNTFERSDPASVRQTAEQAFKQALGRKPRKDELERFTSAFLGREQSAQAAVFDVQDSMDSAQRQQALDATAAASSGAAPADLPSSGSEADVLWSRLQRMIADAPGKITPGKRTRSYQEQVALYAKYKAGKGAMAAKPGTSKHGDGRANDLKYENDAVRQWALANAHKYGLAFPIYNPKLARSRDESWHIEVKKGTLPAGHNYNDGHDHGPAPSGQPPISQDVTVQRQDLGAQAIEFARNSNPTETAAYDIGSQFDQLLNMIQKGLR